MQRMADEETAAQVHPEKLTNALLEASKKAGTSVRIGTVEGILSTSNGQVSGSIYACHQKMVRNKLFDNSICILYRERSHQLPDAARCQKIQVRDNFEASNVMHQSSD